VGKQGNNIQHTKPPPGMLLVPDGTHLPVIKKTYGNLCIAHKPQYCLFLSPHHKITEMDSDSKMDAPTPIIFGPQNDERPDLSGRRYIHSLPLPATSFHLKSLLLTTYSL